MPVTLLRAETPPEIANLRERRLRRGALRDRGRRLRIELVNNMPDGAVAATQRQFLRLLEDAAHGFDVALGLMTLASIARADEARREMAEYYRTPGGLAAAAPDAVIVTGAEPRADELYHEPYWRELCEVFDAAHARAHATLASCLAAHALVWRRDGVRRRRGARKWSGLYATDIATPHPLTEGLTPGPTPHSRWNGLDEADLVAKGYVVLTRSAEAGVDMFVKDREHLALMFQGHPEYDGDTLAREFRRDAARMAGGGPAPHAPDHYYDVETQARLEAALAGAAPLPASAMIAPRPTWRGRGAIVVANWLAAIAARKAAACGPTSLRARWGG